MKRKRRRQWIIALSALIILSIIVLGSIGGIFYQKISNSPSISSNTVIVLSLDGFRAEYIDRGLSPSLLSIGKVLAILWRKYSLLKKLLCTFCGDDI